MRAIDYIFQDVKWHYSGNGFLKLIARGYYDLSYRFCILLRMNQLLDCRGIIVFEAN